MWSSGELPGGMCSRREKIVDVIKQIRSRYWGTSKAILEKSVLHMARRWGLGVGNVTLAPCS